VEQRQQRTIWRWRGGRNQGTRERGNEERNGRAGEMLAKYKATPTHRHHVLLKVHPKIEMKERDETTCKYTETHNTSTTITTTHHTPYTHHTHTHHRTHTPTPTLQNTPSHNTTFEPALLMHMQLEISVRSAIILSDYFVGGGRVESERGNGNDGGIDK